MKIDIDMTSDAFFALAWGICGSIVLAIVLGITYYNVSTAELKAELIAKGGDPQKVACAFEDSIGDNPVCVALATKN
jgi:hypothetical protein